MLVNACTCIDDISLYGWRYDSQEEAEEYIQAIPAAQSEEPSANNDKMRDFMQPGADELQIQ